MADANPETGKLNYIKEVIVWCIWSKGEREGGHGA
jgi:hypothetical protein